MTVEILLLSDASPCLRTLVLTELLQRGVGDAEVLELIELREKDPLVVNLIALQAQDGRWTTGDKAWRARHRPMLMTSMALFRLGYLGFKPSFEPVRRGAEYLFSLQKKNGSWPISTFDEADRDEAVSSSPLQTALPLRALAVCGYAEDKRSEAAYEWLINQRLDDGAWPTGHIEKNLRGVAGYRRIAHSKWGCRSNTTAALQCLAHHPDRSRGPEARRALDLLLGRETRDAHVFGFETARMVGAEAATGFLTFFARFDVALMLDLAWRVGANLEDERVADAVTFAESLRGPYGLWDYSPEPQCSRWITFDILRSLARLDEESDWISLEPRTPFHPYPAKQKRY